MSNFKIISKQKQARAGVLKTAHGEVETPIFMPVGTQGSVKALSPDDLKICGAEIILGNTYHLNLRPGSKIIKKLGGLHKFMGWSGPVLTDSGGFQAFSLGAMIEHGVRKVAPARQHRGHPEERYSDEGANRKMDSRLQSRGLMAFGHRGNDRGEWGEGREGEVLETHSHNITNKKPKSVKNNVDKREKNSKGREEVLNKITNNKTILSTISDSGVLFTSHLDGTKHLLTPEKSIEVQLDLGSDICLVLDELLSPLHDKKYVKKSLERTRNWGKRSQDFFKKKVSKSINPTAQLFGILQGVYDQEIRQNEAKWVAKQGFNGISIGGSFGTSKYWPGSDPLGSDPLTDWAELGAIKKTFEWVTHLLPENLPRHALGVGEVQDFFECIERGVDMFDCVAPTRRARNGSLYICLKHGGNTKNKFTLGIQKSEFKIDPSPIDKDCLCYTCQNFSKAYLRHLYVSSEILYHRLATIHNVYFCVNLTKQIREAIINGQFKKLKEKWLGSELIW